jgi:hypothetical protein
VTFGLSSHIAVPRAEATWCRRPELAASSYSCCPPGANQLRPLRGVLFAQEQHEDSVRGTDKVPTVTCTRYKV